MKTEAFVLCGCEKCKDPNSTGRVKLAKQTKLMEEPIDGRDSAIVINIRNSVCHLDQTASSTILNVS
jgi:hypothetical protein